MDDFLHFIRRSSSLIFTDKSKTKTNDIIDVNKSSSSTNRSRLAKVDNPILKYLNNPCIHVAEGKWDDLWRNTIEPRANTIKGLVFVNPHFARPYYVPVCNFVCDCDDITEYNTGINNEILSLMKKGQYEQWMQTTIRSDAAFIYMHVCNTIELLDRFCIRCPQLTRLSLHYYCVDPDFATYIAKYMPNLQSLNIENSIGLGSKAFNTLGTLQLTHLNVSGCDIYENSLSMILTCFPNLESLNISNNCSITGHCLANSGARKLKRLNLRDCWRITQIQFIDMLHLGLPNLLELLCNSVVCDESMEAVMTNCPNLLHLDISFEEFTYNDQSGYNVLTEQGFGSIAKMSNLKVLRLRHVGRVTDQYLAKVLSSCTNLIQLTLNVRHRHKLTDEAALTNIGINCSNLMYFEAVHNHFIGKNSINELAGLENSLQVLILRGNELVKDEDMAQLIQRCVNLRILNLDGCVDISMNTLTLCIIHARKLKKDFNDTHPQFRASLVLTSIERSIINTLMAEFPSNFRVRACDYDKNKLHYNEFDGNAVQVHQLRESFFPYYWHDFN